MPATYRIYVPLSAAAPFVLESDLLAFRGRRCVAGLIQRGGRGEHSHVGKAVWWGERLFCCESREWKGARAVTLQSQVDRYPGLIDVYRANSFRRFNYDRGGAARYMRDFAGLDYGYASVLRASLAHVPLVRCWRRANIDDEHLDKGPPYCSQAVVMADRLGGGVDPVPRMADAWTEPSDLVRSPFYEGYICTLVPEDYHADVSSRDRSAIYERARGNHDRLK